MITNERHTVKAEEGKLRIYNTDKGLVFAEFDVSKEEALALYEALAGTAE